MSVRGVLLKEIYNLIEVRVNKAKAIVENHENTIKEITNSIASLEHSISVLENSNGSEEAIDSLTVNISKLNLRLAAASSNKEAAENTLKEETIYLQRYLRDYQDNLCRHQNKVYDFTDYHKREDYYKCLDCGKII